MAMGRSCTRGQGPPCIGSYSSAHVLPNQAIAPSATCGSIWVDDSRLLSSQNRIESPRKVCPVLEGLGFFLSPEGPSFEALRSRDRLQLSSTPDASAAEAFNRNLHTRPRNHHHQQSTIKSPNPFNPHSASAIRASW
ncbi:hypothetical protein TWF569_000862 [Orbilia oligospora]|nr:hypothetical protein TWF103_001099 [Orbilia oligospora]KAF3154024.1 hypothetical protein TWF569_000862 [Orbilia oligospora]